jgi:hypothetical protein
MRGRSETCNQRTPPQNSMQGAARPSVERVVGPVMQFARRGECAPSSLAMH